MDVIGDNMEKVTLHLKENKRLFENDDSTLRQIEPNNYQTEVGHIK